MLLPRRLIPPAMMLAALLLVSAIPVSAQQVAWTSRARYRSELGGRYRWFAEDSSGRMLITAETGLQSSTDGGASWRRSSEYGADFRQLQIARDGTLFALFDETTFVEASVVRSTDDGRSWSFLPAQRGYWGFASVAIAPDGSILAGTRGNGIERSTDGGATFNSAWDVSLSSIVPFAFLPGGTILAGEGSGILRSTDGGARFAVSHGAMPNCSIMSLAVDRSAGVFAGTLTKGLWRSTDDGVTWRRVAGLDSTLTVPWVGVRSDGEIFLTADHRREDWPPGWVPTLYRSSDGGATFNAVKYLGRTARVHGPFITRSDDLIATMFDSTEPAFSPLARLEDDGSWTVLGSHLHDHPVTAIAEDPERRVLLAATTIGGPYMSDDGGRDWSITAPPGITGGANAIAVASRGRYFITRDDGVHRTMDFGAHWSMVSEGLPFAPASTIRAMAGDTLVVLVDRRLYSSTTLGADWRSLPLDVASPIIALGSSRDRLAVITDDGTVRWSDDAGRTWSSTAATASDLLSTMHVDDDGTIVCGGANGRVVIVRTDGTVERYSAEGVTQTVATITRARSNGRIAFAAGSRVYLLDDATGSITDASRGMPDVAVLHLAETAEGLVAGLAYGGLMHLDPTSLGVQTIGHRMIAGLEIRPAIASDVVSINSSMRPTADDRLEIVDALGRVVATHRFNDRDASALIRMRVDDFRDGMYWVRLAGGSRVATGRFIVRHGVPQ
jgi:photosystem II stability/assembly factor-like uncharacterized protein